MTELPIVCELSPAELQARRNGLIPGLLALAQERIKLNNGCRWRFDASGEILAAAIKTIDVERRCCRFLKFVLTVEPDEGSMWLEITGPPGTKDFLETLTNE